jgi:hypothetical protein
MDCIEDRTAKHINKQVKLKNKLFLTFSIRLINRMVFLIFFVRLLLFVSHIRTYENEQ